MLPTADLVTFTDKIVNGKLYFLCSGNLQPYKRFCASYTSNHYVLFFE